MPVVDSCDMRHSDLHVRGVGEGAIVIALIAGKVRIFSANGLIYRVFHEKTVAGEQTLN